MKKLEISIYDELRRILSVQTTQEGNPMVLYLAKFMTSTSIVVQRESVGCLAELAQVRSTLIDSPSVGTKIILTRPKNYFRTRKINDIWLKIKSVDIQSSNG